MCRSLGLLVLLVTTVGAAWAAEIEPARQVAEKTAAEWNAAFERGQIDAIVSLYEDNAMLLQPNGVVAHGGSEIRAFWQKLIGQGEYAMDIVSVRAAQNGTVAAAVRFSDVKTLENGNHQRLHYRYDGVVYSVLRQQSDGRWKAEVQRWDGEPPSQRG